MRSTNTFNAHVCHLFATGGILAKRQKSHGGRVAILPALANVRISPISGTACSGQAPPPQIGCLVMREKPSNSTQISQVLAVLAVVACRVLGRCLTTEMRVVQCAPHCAACAQNAVHEAGNLRRLYPALSRSTEAKQVYLASAQRCAALFYGPDDFARGDSARFLQPAECQGGCVKAT